MNTVDGKETDPLWTANTKQDTSATPPFPSTFYELLRDGVVLSNVGSVARDHLANERTYLAWIRTALALIGVGLGLLKLQNIANAPGYIVLLLGIFVLLNASHRYFHVMYRLSRNEFAPNVKSLVGMVAAILIVVFILIVMALSGYL